MTAPSSGLGGCATISTRSAAARRNGILLNAAASGSNALRARSLFAERVGHKVHSSWSWHGYSNALAALGDETNAQAAERRSSELQAAAEG